MLMFAAPHLAVFVVGYLLGSIPFGLILTELAGLGDIRKIGSGNIGATNVLRTGNRWIAGATLLLDGLKGTAAVLVGAAIAPELALTAGLGAFLGHLFPVWLGFRGGKGVATYIGVLAALAWPVAIAFGVVWAATAALTRTSSAGGLVASLASAILMFFYASPVVAVVFAAMTAVLWWRHAANIRRLIAGTEAKIGASR